VRRVAAVLVCTAAAASAVALPAPAATDEATLHVVSLCPRERGSILPLLGGGCTGIGRAELAGGGIVPVRIAWSRPQDERFSAVVRVGSGERTFAVSMRGSLTFIEDNGYFGSGRYRNGVQRGTASWVGGAHPTSGGVRLRVNLTIRLRGLLL
jgi:hypothetical protein